MSDKRLGELPAAVVVIRPNAGKVTEEEIIENSRQFLPKHEVPVMVMLREPKDANDDSGLRIERNANGKIVKSECGVVSVKGPRRIRLRVPCSSVLTLSSPDELKKVVEKEWQRRTKAKL